MNILRSLTVIVMAATAAPYALAQTTISQRVIPGPNGQTPQVSEAKLPMPANVTSQPAAVLPPNPEEMRRRIAAAVEEILSLYGNPPFAEVITNDQVRAAALRAQLAKVAKAESLTSEIAKLTEQRDGLALQVQAKERELAYFREQTINLQQTLAATLDRLSKVPPSGPTALGTSATNPTPASAPGQTSAAINTAAK